MLSMPARTASKPAPRVARTQLLAQIGAAALLALGTFGCGKTGSDDGAPSAEGTTPRAVVPSDYTTACAAACKAHEPMAAPGYDEQQWWCATDSIGECTSQCAQQL